MGLLSSILYHSKTLSREIQENIAFTILIKTDAKQIAIKQFQRKLELNDHVKKTEYISRDEAAQNLEQQLGEDFLKFLGYNPLSNAIDIYFSSYFTQNTNAKDIEKELLTSPIVKEVLYDKNLIDLINKNREKATYFLIFLCLLFNLIAIALINASIRLRMYSKRFLIKTMQLVGATKHFIQKPFILSGLKHGFIAAIIAIIGLDSLFRFGINFIPEMFDLNNPFAKIILYSGILTLGVLIPWICTYFAVRKYLKLTTDELHY
tara:strand:- start:304 stop:1092 length:789 start_codon:yes stop_codon:yes gene_type:complete